MTSRTAAASAPRSTTSRSCSTGRSGGRGAPGRAPAPAAPLAQAAVGGGIVVCLGRHAVFDLATGERRQGPGLGRLRRYAARVEDEAALIGGPLEEALTPLDPEGEPVVIVGAGAAGLARADELRRLGHDGPITLIDREADPLHERTTLSKQFLLGAGRDEIRRIGRDELSRIGVALRFGEAVRAIEPEARRVVFESGETLDDARCFTAPGAAARRLDLPGANLEGVLTLRSADDAETLLSAVRAARQCVVIGGGFIGLEVAGAPAQSDAEIMRVTREDAPGARSASGATSPL